MLLRFAIIFTGRTCRHFISFFRYIYIHSDVSMAYYACCRALFVCARLPRRAVTLFTRTFTLLRYAMHKDAAAEVRAARNAQ